MKVKTNNDPAMLNAKINLRAASMPDKKEIRVLEAFGGEGVLWSRVKKLVPDKNIKILSIDKNQYNRVQQGDNIKYMAGMDLSHFDIIDLDAWGTPVNQLEILFQQHYKGIVHCTFIQSMYGGLPKALLYANGYTDKMLAKISTIFVKDGLTKFYNYLYKRGVRHLTIVTHNRKNYLYFILSENVDK